MLVRALFEQRPPVATELTRPEFHRVNGCKNFRKELSETMALVRALGADIIGVGSSGTGAATSVKQGAGGERGGEAIAGGGGKLDPSHAACISPVLFESEIAPKW